MLSKSQAKAFFLLGTVACSVVFLGLTLDTLKRIPSQTNSEKLTPAAIRGKHLFDKNNCMGCHTILGEGAYYAPELTKVFERRGEGFIKAMLKDPESMYPGKRKMTNYHFSDEQISDLVEFLKWIGQMDLNGFPPKPDLIKVAAPNAVAQSGSVAVVAQADNRPQIFNQMCLACHSLNGQGGSVGPALDGVGTRIQMSDIKKRLLDPQSVKADSKMPKLPLSEDDVTELTAFLSQLKEGN